MIKRVLPGLIPSEPAYLKSAVLTDQITVLLGEMQMTITIFHNGNYIFKPLAVYPTENPGAIRGVPMSHLFFDVPAKGRDKYNGHTDEIILKYFSDPL
jgi:hypothetical protein